MKSMLLALLALLIVAVGMGVLFVAIPGAVNDHVDWGLPAVVLSSSGLVVAYFVYLIALHQAGNELFRKENR